VSPELNESYDKLAKIADVLDEEYNETYLSFPELVIDYVLAEKSDNLAVVPATFDWMDIGSFKDLHEANDSDEKGNYFKGTKIYGDEVENAYIQNDEEKPVVVIGLDNVVVINTPNGILVARKDLSQRVKDAVVKIKADL
jgi:mannose-1-phosphate guanylyltransferase